jgi:hypothetical protein
MPPTQGPGKLFTHSAKALRVARAFGDQLSVYFLHAVGDDLLVNVESHKIGMHSYLHNRDSGRSGPPSIVEDADHPYLRIQTVRERLRHKTS